MKRILIFTFFALVTVATSQAQWSNDPGAPLRVCTTNSQQSNPWVFSDGAGGTFVFWMDSRSAVSYSSWLYAQHYSAAGVRLFPDTGKKVVAYTDKRTSLFEVVRDNQDNYWVTWTFGSIGSPFDDSLMIAKFDKTTLNPLWTKPKLVAWRNPATFNILGFESTQMIATADSLAMVYQIVHFGGSSGNYINRIDKNGNRRFNNGEAMNGCSNCYGPFYMRKNSLGGFYVVKRDGNGAGTGVHAWRYNDSCKVVWAAKSLVDGTPGLSYAFKVEEDGSGGFVMAWVRVGGDIMMTRLNGNGDFVYTPAHKVVCDYSSVQDMPDLRYLNGYWYVSWIDNRPPASNGDVFLQKMDQLGNPMWNPDGRRVIRVNSSFPIPKITNDSDGNILVISHHSAEGFIAQKVRSDSTLAWAGYGLLLYQGNFNAPFYEQFNMAPGPNGQAFVAWQGFTDKLLYISSLDSSGVLTNVKNEKTGNRNLSVYPNPAKDQITIVAENEVKAVYVVDIFGKAVTLKSSLQGNRTVLHIDKLAPGIYFIKHGSQTARFLKE